MGRHRANYAGRICGWCGFPVSWPRYWWSTLWRGQSACADCERDNPPHTQMSRLPKEGTP